MNSKDKDQLPVVSHVVALRTLLTLRVHGQVEKPAVAGFAIN